MSNNPHPVTLPVVHAGLCTTARTAVLVASPVRYSTRLDVMPEIVETDLVVTIVGALGTHYMIWRESPNDRRSPATTIHHVEPARIGYLASLLLAECGVPRARLIDDVSLSQLLVERAAEIGAPSGALAFHLEVAIIAACRATLLATMSSDIQLEVSLRNCLERIACGPSEQLGPRRDGQAFLVLAGMLQERGLVRTVRHHDGTCTHALTPEGRDCLAGMRQEEFGESRRRG